MLAVFDDGKLVCTRSEFSALYRHRYLVLDAVSVVPLSLLSWLLFLVGPGPSSGASQLIAMSRLLLVCRLPRIGRLFADMVTAVEDR